MCLRALFSIFILLKGVRATNPPTTNINPPTTINTNINTKRKKNPRNNVDPEDMKSLNPEAIYESSELEFEVKPNEGVFMMTKEQAAAKRKENRGKFFIRFVDNTYKIFCWSMLAISISLCAGTGAYAAYVYFKVYMENMKVQKTQERVVISIHEKQEKNVNEEEQIRNNIRYGV